MIISSEFVGVYHHRSRVKSRYSNLEDKVFNRFLNNPLNPLSDNKPVFKRNVHVSVKSRIKFLE